MKEFTEDEKVIARNIGKEYKWIARDKNGTLCAYSLNPTKREELGEWVYDNYIRVSDLFGLELFKSIKWEDDEPTRISDIYDPQILDDAEREYLTAVLKPLPKAKSIRKAISPFGVFQYLVVSFNESETMSFPYFEPGTMYKGMECCKLYTPEELGLDL